MKRLLKWIAGIVGGLIVLAVLAVTAVLWSPALGRRVINIALKHAPAGLTIGSIEGPLRSPLHFRHIRYQTATMLVTIDSVSLRWRLSHLITRHLPLDQLHVTGVRVAMADSVPSDTTPARTPGKKPHLPVDVVLGDVVLRDVSVRVSDSMSLQLDSARLGGHAAAYVLVAQATAQAPKVATVAAALRGRGTLESMTLDSATLTLLDGTATVGGDVQWWPAIAWKVGGQATAIRPALVLPDSTTLPGTVSARFATAGKMDSAGPSLTLALDSLAGSLRGQALRGLTRVQLAGKALTIDTLDVGWGAVTLQAAGRVADAFDLHYHLAATDLHGVVPNGGGSLEATGGASGSRATPHITLAARGAKLRVGTNRVSRLQLNANVDLVRAGVIAVDLRGDSATIGSLIVPTIRLGAHGTRESHQILLDGRSTRGLLHLALNGGYNRSAWSGTVAQLRVDSSAAGRWVLQRPAAFSASPAVILLGRLCLARADSATAVPTADSAGAVCVDGRKTGSNWQAAADATALPLAWLAGAQLTSDDSVRGTVSVHIKGAGEGSHVTGEIHLASANAAVSMRRAGDKHARWMQLDSAALNASIGNDGMRGSIGIALTDSTRGQLATLAAVITMPGAARVDRISTTAMTATVDARADDLSFVQPFLTGVDSVRGALLAHVDGSGSVRAPVVKGSVQLQRMAIGLPASRELAGSIDSHIDVSTPASGRTQGTVTVAPQDVRYRWRDLGRDHFLALSGKGLTLDAGADGGQGTIDLHLASDSIAEVATVNAKIALPGYGGSEPIARQVATASVNVAVAHLGALQPLLQQVDSLRGKMTFTVDLQGKVGAPRITAKLAADSLRAYLPFGSTMRGGLAGDFQMQVAADSALTAQLTLQPQAMTFTYDDGSTHQVSLDSSAIRATAGASGLSATTDLVFSEAGARLAAINAAFKLPEYTRFGRPMAAQPLHATLTGKGDNLSFIGAFTPQVDSATGAFTLESKAEGTVADAQLVGTFALQHARMRLPQLGVTLDSLDVAAHGDPGSGLTLQAHARSGGGTLAIDGHTPLKPSTADPGKVHIEGSNFEAANSAQFRAIVSPKLDVTITDALRVQGEVTVPTARLVLSQIPETAVAPSDDVILVDSLSTRKTALPLSADVRLTLGDSVSFSGFNFNARMSGTLRVMQQPNHMATASGAIVIDSGSYKAYGQDLQIHNGQVRFAGGPINDPALDIRAARTAEDSVVAGLEIKGTLKEPDVQVFSEPSMSQTEALSYILTGHAAGQGTGASGNLISKALGAIGLRGGNALAGSLGKQLGLSDAKIEAAGDIKKAAFVAGTYLSPNVYVSYGIGLFNPVSTLRLRYVLSSHITLQTETGPSTGGDILVKSTSH